MLYFLENLRNEAVDLHLQLDVVTEVLPCSESLWRNSQKVGLVRGHDKPWELRHLLSRWYI